MQALVRPWLQPWVGPHPYTEGIAALVAAMGGIWLLLFACLMLVPAPRQQETQPSAWVSGSCIGHAPTRTQGPTLAAVVLNQNHLQEQLRSDLSSVGGSQPISFEVKVWVSPSGRYLSHEILRSNHPQVSTALRAHLPNIDCLPALQNGNPVISWVLFSYHIHPHQTAQSSKRPLR